MTYFMCQHARQRIIIVPQEVNQATKYVDGATGQGYGVDVFGIDHLKAVWHSFSGIRVSDYSLPNSPYPLCVFGIVLDPVSLLNLF